MHFFFVETAGARLPQLLDLFKGYSGFKKRMRSSMVLLLSPMEPLLKAEIVSQLATYKYRNEVYFFPALDQIATAQLIGSAYSALLAGNACLAQHQSISQLLCSGVPMVGLASNYLDCWAPEAYYILRDAGPLQWADALMDWYKNEGQPLQKRLAAHAAAPQLRWSAVAAGLYTFLEERR